MKNGFFCGGWKIEAVVLIAIMVSISNCLAQPQHLTRPAQEASIKSFLQSYVGLPPGQMNKETRYSTAFVDLKGDGSQEVIVYLTSTFWCGTGGCTMLILNQAGDSYKVVTKTTVARLPIRVLTTTSNGWRDIGVTARINGIEPFYEAILSYDGNSYPSNPTTPPARKLLRRVPGRVVISNATADIPLF